MKPGLRFRLRYRLRTLLILMTVCCVALTIYMRRARTYRERAQAHSMRATQIFRPFAIVSIHHLSDEQAKAHWESSNRAAALYEYHADRAARYLYAAWRPWIWVWPDEPTAKLAAETPQKHTSDSARPY